MRTHEKQVALINLFESKNQSASLGLIMHYVGNDSKIVNKINQALPKLGYLNWTYMVGTISTIQK